MKGINKVILIGRVGQDPDFKTASNGESFAKFSLATTEKWKDKSSGEMREKVEWHRLVCWRRLSEIARDYVNKGTLLYVEGQLRTNKWQDKDGADRWTTEINVGELQMLSPKNSNQSQNMPANDTMGGNDNQSMPAGKVAEGPVELDDDLPF